MEWRRGYIISWFQMSDYVYAGFFDKAFHYTVIDDVYPSQIPMDLRGVVGHKILVPNSRSDLVFFSYITLADRKDSVGRPVPRADIFVAERRDPIISFPLLVFRTLAYLRKKFSWNSIDAEEGLEILNERWEEVSDDEIVEPLLKLRDVAEQLFEEVYRNMRKKKRIYLYAGGAGLDVVTQLIYPLLPSTTIARYTYTDIAEPTLLDETKENFIVCRGVEGYSSYGKKHAFIDTARLKPGKKGFVEDVLYRKLFGVSVVERIILLRKYYEEPSAKSLIDIWEKYRDIVETIDTVKRISSYARKMRE